jgi:hypothetical protein
MTKAPGIAAFADLGPAMGVILASLIFAGCDSQPRTEGGIVATASASPSGTVGSSPSAVCSSGAPSPAPGSTLQASPSATASPPSTSGAISGTAGWPPTGVAPQLIYAISTAGPSHGAYSTETVSGQFSYTIKGVAPGAYYVFAALRPLICKGQGTVIGASYSAFATCGSPSCSHAPLEVIVKAGATTDQIYPSDWYSSDNLVPAPPIGIVSALPPQSGTQTYASARDAAVATARVHAAAIVVDVMATCHINRACITIGQEHDGTEAAYFNGEGGSNADVLACMTYVVHDPAGWRGVRSQCPAVFPGVGQIGMVWLGGVTAGSCGANVRSSPGPTGKVVACLQHHTGVTIDSGPVYAPMSSMDGIWWRLAGQGWMADDLLIYPELCGCD